MNPSKYTFSHFHRSIYHRLRSYSTSFPQNFDPLKAWKCAQANDLLARLVILIFSVICCSADCERYFSITGDTKDPTCNRLSTEKMVKTSAIKLDLNHQHAVEGTKQKRIRCSFGLATSASDSNPSGSQLEPELGHPTVIPDSINHSYCAFRNNLLNNLHSDCDVEHGSTSTQSIGSQQVRDTLNHPAVHLLKHYLTRLPPYAVKP